jgi:hypothetical protein
MTRRARTRSDRGAVLVELAIVIPMLLLLMVGMVEYGFAWQRQQVVTRAARSGARLVSHLATDNDADRQALLGVVAGMGGHRDRLELVVIFKDSGSGVVPAACLSASQAGLCNRFDDFSAGGLSVGGFTSNPDNFAWAPSSRQNQQSATMDVIGVYVRYDHRWMTGTFPGSGLTVTDTAVMVIEPATS